MSIFFQYATEKGIIGFLNLRSVSVEDTICTKSAETTIESITVL